jgi:glycosyltransferase involved in cell wall biosynthesis
VRRGHHAAAYVEKQDVGSGELDGVRTYGRLGFGDIERLYKEADVIITHLDCSPRALGYATAFRRPLVFYSHAPNHTHFFRVRPTNASLVIFNAAHSLRGAYTWRGHSLVLHPPIEREQYAVKSTGDAVVLVNLCAEKGAETFYAVAQALPDTRFLGVRGSYGKQVLPPANTSNIEVVGPVADMRTIYEQARVVLMPSWSESWGRVAMEAAASGIPAIVAPTDGLRECMGNAATYIAADNTVGYIAAVRRLLGGVRIWSKASRSALARFAEYETSLAEELKAVEVGIDMVARRKETTP